MGEKRNIPYGVMNWAELVRECLFVDNTAYSWDHPVSVAVVEVCGNAGYNWFDLARQ